MHWNAEEKREQNTNGLLVTSKNPFESFDNNIYFYSEVNEESSLNFNKKIKEIDNANLCQKINRGIPYDIPIYIHICSGGGNVCHGISMMDTIGQCMSQTISLVEGYCCSAATFVSLATNKREMTKNSYMLIHQLSAVFWGKYREFQDEMKNIDLLMNIIRKVYMDKTKMTQKMINDFLNRDLYLDSQKCKKLGLIDEIV